MPNLKHYKKKRHLVWREKVLKKAGGLCEECRRYGRLDADGLPARATVAHHKKPIDEYPELAYVETNGKAGCAM